MAARAGNEVAQNTAVTEQSKSEARSTGDVLDVVIIGGGPAGLAAALYLARAGLAAKVFDRAGFGGELGQIAKIDNYPGFTGAGPDLAAKMRAQAEEAGVAFAYGECQKATRAKGADGAKGAIDTNVGARWRVKIDDENILTRSVLIATGSEPRQLKLNLDPPVSYCALCDGELAKGQNVAVIGGANSAAQEALYLAPLVKQLTLITHSKLKADPVLQKQLAKSKNIQILENTEPTKAMLDNFDRIFVAIGRMPATKFLKNLQRERTTKKDWKILQIEVVQQYNLFDEDGYLLTGGKKSRPDHETVIKGIFAAGDVRSGVEKQVAVAVGDGVTAAIEIMRELRAIGL